MRFPDLTELPIIKTRETEIDSLFVEEIFSSKVFQSWVIKKVGLKDSSNFFKAWKSVHGKVDEKDGEWDILVQFNDGKKKIFLLIEDKVYSPEQPNQAKRYIKTAEELVKNKKCDQCITCLLCSENYFRKDAPMNEYERKISFEELLDWFKKQPVDDRMKFKQMVIQNGIEESKQKWVKKPDPNTTKYHYYYTKIAQEIYPKIKIKEKIPASGKSWIYMKYDIFPPNLIIVHKGHQGFVDLQISKIHNREFFEWWENKEEENKISVHANRESVSVRIHTPKISKLSIKEIEKPEKHRKKIVEALQAVNQLKIWYSKWKDEINSMKIENS